MDNTTKISQLIQARDGQSQLTVDALFNKEEQEVLDKMVSQLEGKTEKQKNPYPKRTLARASWVIARLGGWKGYKTARPPGRKTFERGLEKFDNAFEGWKLFKSG